MTRFRRPLVLLALAAAVLIALATPARAHVTVDPHEATKSGFTKLTFRVPNERDNASTTKVEVKLPDEHPIENVSLKPVPGWTGSLAGGLITWQGGEIKPGQFEEFAVSVGPLPQNADELIFPAVQTYSNGEVVSWSELQEPGGEEPEHPAPVVKLVDAAADTTATEQAAAPDTDDGDNSSDDSKGIAVVALIVGALGLVAGITGLVVGRRA